MANDSILWNYTRRNARRWRVWAHYPRLGKGVSILVGADTREEACALVSGTATVTRCVEVRS
jgi:hypothetical protein